MKTLLQRLHVRGSVAAAAILSLAIGIGANTAVFSVANALLLRPLNYRDADRLAILWNRSPGLNIAEDWFSTAQYFDIKHGHSGFEDIAIALGANYNLTGSGVEPERVGVIRVSSNLLPMLGAQPAAGQLLVPEDDVPGQSGTAVLSYKFWTRRFGGERSAIGQSIILNAMRLLMLFAVLALVLAAIGTYAVMAFIVSQGTREMGIRLALGATPGGIISLVVRQGLSVAVIGVVLGLAGAFALTRVLSNLIFGVSSTDPLTYAAVAVVLGGVALLASAVPARRASRIDPAISLRNE